MFEQTFQDGHMVKTYLFIQNFLKNWHNIKIYNLKKKLRYQKIYEH